MLTPQAYDGHDTNLNWFVQQELYGGDNSAISAVGIDDTVRARR